MTIVEILNTAIPAFLVCGTLILAVSHIDDQIERVNKRLKRLENDEPTPTVQNLTAQLKFYKDREEMLMNTIRSMSQALSIHEIHIIRDEDKKED